MPRILACHFLFFSVPCFFRAPFHPNLSPTHRCECALFLCHYPSQLLASPFFFSPALFVTLSSLSPTLCRICECPVFSLIALFFFTRFFRLPVQPLPNACCICECPVFSPLTFCFFSVPCFFRAPFHPNLSPTHGCECALFLCHYPSQLLASRFFFSPAFFVTLSSLSPTHCRICECPVFRLSLCFFHSLFPSPCPASPQRIAVFVSSPYSRLSLFFSLSRAFYAPSHPNLSHCCECALFLCHYPSQPLANHRCECAVFSLLTFFHCPKSRPSAVCTSPLQSQTSKCPSLAPVPPSSNQTPPLRQCLPPKH